MMQKFNPGNVNYRLGHVLELYEEAVREGKLEVASNLLDIIADYISVFLTKKQWAEYEAMPGFKYGDNRGVDEVWSDMRKRKRWLLEQARRKNVFARDDPKGSVGTPELDEEEDGKQ